jgi:hypothetical protein
LLPLILTKLSPFIAYKLFSGSGGGVGSDVCAEFTDEPAFFWLINWLYVRSPGVGIMPRPGWRRAARLVTICENDSATIVFILNLELK